GRANTDARALTVAEPVAAHSISLNFGSSRSPATAERRQARRRSEVRSGHRTDRSSRPCRGAAPSQLGPAQQLGTRQRRVLAIGRWSPVVEIWTILMDTILWSVRIYYLTRNPYVE